VITLIHGLLRAVHEEDLVLRVDAFDIAVLIPEYARRQLQGRVGEMVALHTIFYIEGNAAVGSRLTPRLIGFTSPIDREFFEIFCSVDGVGVRKALRAMVRPVRELARTIQDQDVRMLATFPGIGEAMAERIVAKLRRKVGKFTLIVNQGAEAIDTVPAEANGSPPNAEPDVIRDTYAALLSVGHTETQARQAIDRVLSGKRKFRSVPEMIEAIYYQQKGD
jgi:Holliday junction DNA helicase RuvA